MKTTYSLNCQRLLRIFAILASASILMGAGCASTTDDAPADDQQQDQSDNGDQTADGAEAIRSSASRITNPSVANSTLAQLTGDNADFAYSLYSELAKEESGNFFYSPHSISSALAMTYAGAEGTSESQMKSALKYRLPESKLHPAFNKLDLALESRASQTGNNNQGSPFKLEIANTIWGQKGYPFKQPFLDTLAKHYGAGLQGLDFRETPDRSRKIINAWVEKKTENKIKDLMPPSSINRNTRLVLTNAIYFKASWAHKFDKNQTHKQSFTTKSGQSVQVDMMRQKKQNGYTYTSGSNWQAVGLPYVGDKVSMVLIVPDSGALDQIEQQLSGSWVNSVFSSLSQQAVILEMPKFNIETKFSAKKMLKALGMTTPFTADANFTGMAPDNRLFIQDVIHQSFVSVDEKGTEAAAATGVSTGVTSVPQFKQVTVDRPFIFVIQDRETNAVIFTGRVTDPS